MQLFVTGATGFVGSQLVRKLGERGDRLRLLLRPESNTGVLDSLEHEAVAGDLFDEPALSRGLDGCDAVVHLAAMVSFQRRDRDAMFRINADATRSLARAAKRAGVHRFLLVSSVVAVGFSKKAIVLDESTPWPLGGYGIGYCDSKRLGEDHALAECAPDFEVVVVNPSSMFGPGDRRKAEGSLLERMAYGRVPFCPPGGACFADVLDVCDGIVRALDRGRSGERYILGGENLTGRALLEKIAAILGTQAPKRTLPGFAMAGLQLVQAARETVRPVGGPLTAELLRLSRGYSWYSSAKAERELDYRPQPLDRALRATFDWMLETGLLDPERTVIPADRLRFRQP